MAGPADRAPARLAPAATPAAIEGALSAQGMNQGGNFTPGRPLQPYFGYSTPARAQDYPVGVNIATQGRAAWGKVSFDVLKALIDAYDVARMCINHKIDELRSMPLMFQPAEGVEDDVDDAIDAARAVLAYPDRELPYDSWLSKWLENALKYDACPLYKRRDYNGDIIGLEVVDGRTIAPYIDENGRRPRPPAPAFWQVIHGMVGTWFTTDDLIYTPFRPQEDSPYGLAPIESVIITANTDIRFQWHFLQLFTDGSVPAGFMEVPPDVSEPEQVREWQDHWDAMVMGDQAKLHQLLAVPNGSKYTGTKPATFDPKFPEWLMKRTCAAFGVVPQDLGLVSDVNRANGETQVDIQFRVNTLPWVRFVEGTLTRYLQRDIGLPVKVSLDTGRDKEDRLQEAQAHQLYVEMGAESPDEVRVDILGKRVDKERPTPRFFSTQRLGPVTLLAIEGAAGKTDPDTYGPAKDQLVLDQPYVPPIPVVPTPGTTDDKASQAAIDAYQVQTRRALEGQEDPKRESQAQREARGAKQQQPGTGDAPLKPTPQGSQAQQQASGQREPQQAGPVAKAADLTGAEAAELSAFRTFVYGCKRRGEWRDFVFKAVSPAVASELNRGGRAEVATLLKAKTQHTAPTRDGDTVAREVYRQLLEDFPPDKVHWVLGLHWTGPQTVPLDQVDFSNEDSWAASHDPRKVAKTAAKLRAGKKVKPAILIDRTDHPQALVADGHHRAKAYRQEDRGVYAYVAHPRANLGPWDEMHASQIHGQVAKTADTEPDPPGALAAGIALRAADTGRVLMLQRGLDPSDPAAGMWEFPGGRLDSGEGPQDAAAREFTEETGRPLPASAPAGAWVSANGIYHGFVRQVPRENAVDLTARDESLNPDDPDGDQFEALAWWDPDQLLSNPAVRRELAADLAVVIPLLRGDPQATALTKAVGDPKAQARPGDTWPGWQLDLPAIAYWAALLAGHMLTAVDALALARAYLAATPAAAHTDDDQGKRKRLIDATIAFLGAWGLRTHLAQAISRDLAALWSDGYLIGGTCAQAVLDAVADGTPLDQATAQVGDWQPGRTQIAQELTGELGDGAGLRELLDTQGIEIRSIAQSRLEDLARLLADGVLRGASAEQLAEEIKALLGNQARAHLIATTEIARASSAAAMRAYQRAGVNATRQITAGDARVCATCQANAAAGAVPIGTPYPSGDLQCPVHPGDRCANIPA